MTSDESWAEAYRPLRLGKSSIETRLLHCLRNAGYRDVIEAMHADPEELMKIKMFGRKCLERLQAVRSEIIEAAFAEEVEQWDF